jgi:hypothetical protein
MIGLNPAASACPADRSAFRYEHFLREKPNDPLDKEIVQLTLA